MSPARGVAVAALAAPAAPAALAALAALARQGHALRRGGPGGALRCANGCAGKRERGRKGHDESSRPTKSTSFLKLKKIKTTKKNNKHTATLKNSLKKNPNN